MPPAPASAAHSSSRPPRRPLSPARAAELAALLKALSDPVRLRLLSIIAACEDPRGICVCDLMEDVAVSQPTISHHLKKLREAGIIAGDRSGTWVYYKLLPGALSGVGEVPGSALTAAADR